MITELLDKLIEEAKQQPHDITQLKHIAGLKVFKKDFETQRLIGTETKKFSNPSQVLNYSWRLFKDKINDKKLLLGDQHNPKVKFNISKYYEFKFGTELCNVDTNDIEEIQ